MDKLLENFGHNVVSNMYVICENTFNFEHLENILTPDMSVIYFDKSLSLSNPIFQAHAEKKFDKLIVVGNTDKKITKKRLFINNYISKSALEHVKCQLLVVISEPKSFNDAKKIIKQLITLNQICASSKRTLTIPVDENYILGYLIENGSAYTQDFINALFVLTLDDQKSKYKYIYDTTCKFLDNQFVCKNYCNFKNDKCIANRNKSVLHCDMGCCYSFEYSGFFEPTFTKNDKLCEHLNGTSCSTSCMSCKLFTCKELQKRNIRFKLSDFLLINCFFNKKQHLILKYNFFKTREAIIEKLLEEDSSPYLIYYLKSKYRI